MGNEVEIMDYGSFSVENLWSELKNEGFMCYGFGRGFTSFYNEVIAENNLGQCLEAVIDSDESKIGTQTISDKKLRVIGLDEVDKCKNLIITTAHFQEIYEKIKNNKAFSNVYYYGDIRNKVYVRDAKQIDLPSSFRVYDKPRIPKIIHYCWFGDKPMPGVFRNYLKSWRKYCPDYEIKEWNENNYDIEKNKYMLAAYRAKKWGFVPDYARLDIVYRFGGVYLDTDVELLRSLDDFLYEDAFAGYEPGRKVALGLGFGAIKGLDIIREMRDNYDNLSFKDYQNRKEMRNINASPIIQTRFLENKYGLVWKNELTEIGGMRIYPLPVLCGKIGKETLITDKTYAIHHYAASWVPE